MSRVSWLRRSAVELWERARRERSTPREIGCSVGLGVFTGFTPAFGFHMWVAIALATVFRLNRVWTFLGSRVSFLPLYTWIVFCEVEIAHHLRTGTWARVAPHEALAHAKELLGDWALGAALLGLPAGLAAGAIAYAAARRFTQRTRGGPLLPSSGSTPSAPPAPAP